MEAGHDTCGGVAFSNSLCKRSSCQLGLGETKYIISRSILTKITMFGYLMKVQKFCENSVSPDHFGSDESINAWFLITESGVFQAGENFPRSEGAANDLTFLALSSGLKLGWLCTIQIYPCSQAFRSYPDQRVGLGTSGKPGNKATIQKNRDSDTGILARLCLKRYYRSALLSMSLLTCLHPVLFPFSRVLVCVLARNQGVLGNLWCIGGPSIICFDKVNCTHLS